MESTALNCDSGKHEEFVLNILNGDSDTRSMVDDITFQSWKRCYDDFGLNPSSVPEIKLLQQAELEERLEQNCHLLDFARPEMTNLYQQLSGSGHAIMLTDSAGTLLNYIGDPQFTDLAARSGMCTGAAWSEEAQGTNGMGTCLVEKKPIVIHKQAHFFSSSAKLTCAAAPIFDPHGEILAVLDASSQSNLAQQHTMVLLNMSAQVIENRAFFCAMSEAFVIRFHSRAEFINTLGEGTIAFDAEGRIIAANRSAMFQLEVATSQAVVGRQINELFTVSLPKLLTRAYSHDLHAFPIRECLNGQRFYAILQPPKGAARPIHTKINSGPANSDSTTDPLDALHFGDPQMEKNIQTAKKIVTRDIPCMLFGETGTGKDMFAKALHQACANKDTPYVAVNCASLPEALIESELFGYQPGAFTGASREGSRGKIVQANGGTLFLDEIGDMPLPLQARLLRVLEEREVIPLGGEKPIKVSIRLISATHHDLQSLIEQGKFREDLYYRLHGVSLTMPPLRSRTDRLELIKKIGMLVSDDAKSIPNWRPEVLDALDKFSWPGNIRQLKNVLGTASVLCENNTILLSDLPIEIQLTDTKEVSPDSRANTLNTLDLAERDALLDELEAMHWNISRVSKNLGLSRNTLYRRMKRYEISPPR